MLVVVRRYYCYFVNKTVRNFKKMYCFKQYKLCDHKAQLQHIQASCCVPGKVGVIQKDENKK
jgi:hypothetical protein